MKQLLSIAVLGALALTPLTTSAQSTMTKPLAVSATIIPGCTSLTVPTGLGFGTFAPLTQPSATGSISYNCANGIPVFIDVDLGLHPFSGSGPREMANTPPTTALAYDVCSDGVACATQWPASPGLAATGTGSAATKAIFAKLTAPVATNTPAGAYADTLVITLTF